MKLIFEKDQENNLNIKIRDGLGEKEFSYVDMIKSLRNSNTFEDSEFHPDINEEDKGRIDAMLAKINEVITERSNRSS